MYLVSVTLVKLCLCLAACLSVCLYVCGESYWPLVVSCVCRPVSLFLSVCLENQVAMLSAWAACGEVVVCYKVCALRRILEKLREWSQRSLVHGSRESREN